MSPLWFGALLPLSTAVLLVYVGSLIARRPTKANDALAMRLFAVWWFSAATIILLASAPTLLSLLGVSDMEVIRAISIVNAAPLAIGLCSLLYYLVYIYTGRRKAIWPLAAAYAVFFAFEIVYFTAFGPRHLEASTFAVRSVADARPPAWMRIGFGLGVAVPILAALVAYASLYPRAGEPAARRRIALVSTAFGVWFAPVLLALLLDWSRYAWFPLVYQAPGVVAAILIVMAYRPHKEEGWQ